MTAADVGRVVAIFVYWNKHTWRRREMSRWKSRRVPWASRTARDEDVLPRPEARCPVPSQACHRVRRSSRWTLARMSRHLYPSKMPPDEDSGRLHGHVIARGPLWRRRGGSLEERSRSASRPRGSASLSLRLPWRVSGCVELAVMVFGAACFSPGESSMSSETEQLTQGTSTNATSATSGTEGVTTSMFGGPSSASGTSSVAGSEGEETSTSSSPPIGETSLVLEGTTSDEYGDSGHAEGEPGGPLDSSSAADATTEEGPTCSSTNTLEHCGACNHPCDASYANMRCVAGDCVIDSCMENYCDVDGVPRNGCEEPINVFSDPNNCGSCGNVCPSQVCNGGVCRTRAFVTSAAYRGNLGGLPGADEACQDLAIAGGLGGTWRAWLSTNAVSAAARLRHTSGPIARIDGVVIANDWDDLTDGTLARSLTVNELGEELAALNYSVWTNTNSDGASSGVNDCNGWTSSSFDIVGAQGSSDYTDVRWTVLSNSVECGIDARIYCFEQ